MIHVATYRLLVADGDGKPVALDIGLLEKRLADAFRKLGFSDVWMAEDIAMTVEEKIRTSDANLVSLDDVDSIVISVLNASGFSDVAREYSAASGHDALDAARKEMRPWEGRISDALRHALPLTEAQLADVEKSMRSFLTASGISVASDRFLVELAVHLLVNTSGRHVHFVERTVAAPDARPILKSCTKWQDMRLGDDARSMMENGAVRPLPFSEIFPRARIAVAMKKVTSMYAGGMATPMGIYAAMTRTAPSMLEILGAMRMELSARHPLQADSPSHILFPDFMEFLEMEPTLWKRKDRLEIRETVEQVMDEKVVSIADFPIVVSIR